MREFSPSKDATIKSILKLIEIENEKSWNENCTNVMSLFLILVVWWSVVISRCSELEQNGQFSLILLKCIFLTWQGLCHKKLQPTSKKDINWRKNISLIWIGVGCFYLLPATAVYLFEILRKDLWDKTTIC